ncbi:hypothetical protein JCM11641_000319 [Rhodosporidiobolus odoratus]
MPHSIQPPLPSTSSSPPSHGLLIDLALSPPLASSSSTGPLRPSSRHSLSAPSLPSSVKKSSPLRFSFFEDSFDETTSDALAGMSDGRLQAGGAYRAEEEAENAPLQGLPKGRATGKKWGVMSVIREEKSRRRKSRSLSPVKEGTSVREGDTFVNLTTQQIDGGDLSLIVDEGGSFLLSGGNGSDVTLESFALSDIGEEAEDSVGDVGEVLAGGMLRSRSQAFNPRTTPLHQTPKLPSSKSTPSFSSNILPSSLTSNGPLSRSLSRSAGLALAALPPVPPLDAEHEPIASHQTLSPTGSAVSAAFDEPSFLLPPAPTAKAPDLLAGLAEPSFLLSPPDPHTGEASLLAAVSEPSFLLPTGTNEPSLLTATAEPSFLIPGNTATFVHDPSLGLNVSTVAEEGPEADMSFLNASTASFKDYRDSPVKPRIVSIAAERWDGYTGNEGAVKQERMREDSLSEISESGSSGLDEGTSTSGFGLTGWGTMELKSVLFDQAPPTAALQPESTSTLLIGLQSPMRPTLNSIFVPPASTSPNLDDQRDLLACSTRTLTPGLDSPLETPTPVSPAFPPSLSTSSLSQAATLVPEGDLLGIGNVAPSPPRLPLSTSHVIEASATSARTGSGADKLARRLEELRAAKIKPSSRTAPLPSSSVSATPRQRRTSIHPDAAEYHAATPAAPHPFAASRPSTVVKPGRSLKSSKSSPNLASSISTKAPAESQAVPAPRLGRPRQSTLPSSIARPSTPPPARASSAKSEAPKTPGERKESTRARLERLREARQAREQIGASPEKKPATTGGLQRRASMAPQVVRPRTSLALPGPAVGKGMSGSKSLSNIPATRGSSAGALTKPATTASSRPASRPSLGPTSSLPAAGTRSATATAPRPSSRPSLARTSASASSSSAPSLLPASSSSSAVSGTKRPAPQQKLQFSSMPLPRTRPPLKSTQTVSSAAPSTSTGKAATASSSSSTGAPTQPVRTLKPRTSRIGLARPSLAGPGVGSK